MKLFFSHLIILFSFFISLSINSQSLTSHNVIPRPSSVVATNDTFTLLSTSAVHLQGIRKSELTKVSDYLVNELRPSTGFTIPVRSLGEAIEVGSISLSLTNTTNTALGAEGYELTITKTGVAILANEPAGAFYGVQTLLQLLPSSILKKTVQTTLWEMHTGIITDSPSYEYRGTMLDIARHFFLPEVIKREIDRIARYKMNVFQLHLTDDQGWRIEINSRPRLTTIGASTQVGGGLGGFLTQAQYTDIIQYANDRFITVIPEIDLPGHIMAALASYAELNCDNIAKSLYTGTSVGISTLCADENDVIKPEVITFMNDVLKEIAAITPGKYIHIGGDEAHITEPAAYKEFIRVAQNIVNGEGKIMIGWADISSATLNLNSLAQFWQTTNTTALAAVAQGVKIIMSPANKIYLDIKYNNSTPIGLTWAGLNDCVDAYSWNPATFTSGINKNNIHGVLTCLWTETVETESHIDLLTYPRLPGVAEAGWSDGSLNNWEEYKIRLGFHQNRFENLNIGYYKSPFVPWNDDLNPAIADLYCTASGASNGQLRWITNLSTTNAATNLTYVNSMHPPGSYNHYTTNTLTINQASNFTLNINASDDTRYTRAKAWIDWNGDGDFEDTGEEIISIGEYQQNNPSVLNISQNIAVPVSATIGVTRMRIRYADAWLPLAVPCGTIDFSVTHDFNVNVIASLAVNDFESASNITLFPNPNNGDFTLKINKPYAECEIRIYNMLGQIIDETKTGYKKEVQFNIERENGVYFAEIILDKTIKIIKKIIKK